MIRIFIGYDERQPIAFNVCAHSIWEHASKPVEIVRLDLRTLPITRRGLTSFTYSRFLVPYLSDFKDVSIFLDSDMLVRCDLSQLLQHIPYEMDHPTVALRQGELKFEWSSMMVFNNEQCKRLTPEYVQDPKNKLFDMAWAEKIQALPEKLNHLVGYDPPNPDAHIVHFTRGIPVWQETARCEFANEWVETFKRMNFTVSFQELMSASVHWPKVAQ